MAFVNRVVVALAVLARTASADAPTFVSLDRATGHSLFGAHLGLMLFEDQDSDGGAPTLKQPRLQVFGEYAINPRFGLVASASVILFHVESVDSHGLGPIHLGGYYRHAVDNLELFVRGALVLPTSSYSPEGSYFEHVAVHGTLFPWLEERTLDANTLWFHGGPSLHYRTGNLSVQVDALVDVPVRDLPMRIHLGGAVAYRQGPWRATGELLASGYMLADDPEYINEIEDDVGVLFGLTLSAARQLDADHELVVWFANPLDEYLRSRWHAVGIGYQGAL